MPLPDSKDNAHFLVHDTDPINAEPESEQLVEHWKTPASLTYLRNHGDIMHIPREGYSLHLDIEDSLEHHFDANAVLANEKREKIVTLDTLLSLGKVNLAAALQCAGNRRAEMNEIKRVEGIQWENGTILNAQWSGILLRRFLLSLGLPENYQANPDLANAHVHFFSEQKVQEAESYEVSVPLRMAMDESRSVLLADTMNGEPLADEHGGPIRAVVPGVIGARSCKFLHTIRIKTTPSTNFYMTSDYKRLPPDVTAENKAEWMEKTDPLQELGLQSSIGNVTQTEEGILIQGYAVDGHGSAIKTVEICVLFDSDELTHEDLIQDASKRKWVQASLEQEEKKAGEKTWSWTLFSATLPIETAWKGQELAFVCKATAADGREEERETEWNLRGVANQGWSIHRHFICR